MDTIFDVTNVILTEDKLVCALFDGRYDSIAIITPTDTNGELKLQMSEPDGLERYYWLDKLGLLPKEELTSLYETVKTEKERRDIYEKLKGEFDAPRVAMLDEKEKALQDKEQNLLKREGKLKELEQAIRQRPLQKPPQNR
jgi:hypothetical protein